MPLIQLPDSRYLIPIAMFDTCVLDGLSRADIAEYSREEVTTHKSVYYLDKFAHHLKIAHGEMSMRDYCVKHLGIEWPKCPTKGTDVGWKSSGKGLILSRLSQGGVTRKACPAFDKSCNEASEKRMGDGNPMYGKRAWNTGLRAKDDERVAKSIAAAQAKAHTPEAIEKSRQAKLGKPSPTKGRRIHTDERREWFRGHTARLWQRGVFNRVSSIHIKMREFLTTLPLKETFIEEYTIEPFSVDFGFPLAKIAIEADGDYYHVNPQFYPNGPENAMQRRNFGRDKVKDKYLAAHGWMVIRAWECDINSGAFKDPLICKLKQSGLLNA